MNKEGLSSTETLEKQDIFPATLETKESGKDFANKILAKIKSYMDSFTSKDVAIKKVEEVVSFEDPAIKDQIKNEINLDDQLSEIDNEVEKLQTETSENVNSIVRDFSINYHHPEYRKEVTKQIIEARNTGQDAEAVRSSFYDKTANEKENFESQEKERSVAEIMKEKDLVIVHAMPLYSGEERGSYFNNRVIKNAKNLGFEDTYNLIAGLSPTLSTSIPSPDRSNNGLFKSQGVILGDGKILTAHGQDSGSEAFSINKRIPKLGNENNKHSAIQPEIDIDKIVKRAHTSGSGAMWNELTVEKPQIAGLFQDLSIDEKYYDINNETWKATFGDIPEADMLNKIKEHKDSSIKASNNELLEMKKMSEKFNVPLYAFKNEEGKLNKYSVEFIEHPEYTEDYLKQLIKTSNEQYSGKFGTEEFKKYYQEEYLPVKNYIKNGANEYKLHLVTASDIYNHKPEISDEQKKQIAQGLKDKKIIQ